MNILKVKGLSALDPTMHEEVIAKEESFYKVIKTITLWIDNNKQNKVRSFEISIKENM